MRMSWLTIGLFTACFVVPYSQSFAEPPLPASTRAPVEHLRNGRLKTFLVANLKPDFDAQSEAKNPTQVFSADVRVADGRKLVVVFIGGFWCSATGMCGGMILEPRGRTYKVLFDGSVRRPIRLLTTSTNGYPDISVNIHESWDTNYDVRLRFDGKRYVEKEKLNGYVHEKRLPHRPSGRLLIGYKSKPQRLYP